MKKIITMLCLAVLSACGEKDNRTGSEENDKVAIKDVNLTLPPAGYGKVNAVKFPPPIVKEDREEISKKIIKEGDIAFETNDVAATRKAIYDQLTKLKGYASGENETNNGESNRKEYTINAKVPAKNFDLFLNGVAAAAMKVDSKNISMQDVTAQYIDINTRLENKKKLEARYLELLKKGTKISDLLEIENKLTEIRTDIESTQGQLNYMEKQIEYSSLDITFYTKQNVKETGKTFGYRLTAAFGRGWEILGVLFFGSIGLWPFLLIALFLLVMIRKWRAARRRRKAN